MPTTDLIEADDMPDASPPCACNRFRIITPILSETSEGSGIWNANLQVICRDCGTPLTQLTSSGFDDTLRIRFGRNLEERLAAERTERVKAAAAARAATSQEGLADARSKISVDPKRGLPGSKMLWLTGELGITVQPGCPCKSQAMLMDQMGVEGCRKRRNELVMVVEANLEAWDWKVKLLAAPKAVWKGLGLGIDPRDPVGCLVDLAVDMAEKDAAALAADAVTP